MADQYVALPEEGEVEKIRKEATSSLLIQWVSTCIWIYYYSSKKIEAFLFYDDFLSDINITQISISAFFILVYLLSRNKVRMYAFYKRLKQFFIFLLFLDAVLFITILSTQKDPFSDKYQYTYLMITCMVLAISNAAIVAACECRILTALTLYSYAANQLVTNLIEQYRALQNNIQDLENEQIQQRRTERIQSLEPSQLNLVYGHQCSICDEECDLQQKAVQLPCLHIFHGECIRTWLSQQRICPNCRLQVY